MPPLPIFRLPQLVLIKVINSMNLVEQIVMAQCSQRAYARVKQYRNKKNILTLDSMGRNHVFVLNEEAKSRSLEILCRPWKPSRRMELSKKDRIQLKISNCDECDYIFTYWENPQIGARTLLELLWDLFPIHVGSVWIYSPDSIWTLDWFKNRKKSPTTVYVLESGFEIPDNDLKRILFSYDTDQMFVKMRPSRNFQIEKFCKTFGYLEIHNAFWMSIPNLMTLDCIEITVHKKFTCSEVNQFLKHWINGGSPRLQFLIIGVKRFNHNEVFADIQNHLFRLPIDMSYTSPYGFEFVFDDLQIERNDGVVASIEYFEESIYMGVWPDASGRA